MRESRAPSRFPASLIGWRAPCEDADFTAMRSRVHPVLQAHLLNLLPMPMLSAADEARLGSRIMVEQCPASFERLFRANILLVVAIARNFGGRGLRQPDVVDSGKVGLVYAVGSFDPSTGIRFSSAGGWWIKQAIRLAITETTKAAVSVG